MQNGVSHNNMIPNKDRDKPLSRLLVVDDEPDDAQVSISVLSTMDFGRCIIYKCQRTTTKFKSSPQGYCLVLSDNWMPELSGIQLARNVRD